MRALAVLSVVLYHADVAALPGGFLGVELFFVVSGFLITTLLLRERDQSGTISLSGFYIRRTLRIFPLYYAVIALYTVVVMVTEKGSEPGRAFIAIESPRGQYAAYAISDGSDQPFRLRIHDPSYFNLQSVGLLTPGHLVADIMAIMASLDPIMGGIDK